ncbi:MAG: hypothetical protein WAO21_11960 [Verrucomicrobiia bacterium]
MQTKKPTRNEIEESIKQLVVAFEKYAKFRDLNDEHDSKESLKQFLLLAVAVATVESVAGLSPFKKP